MNLVSAFLLVLNLVQFSQAALYKSVLLAYWDAPAGLQLTAFKTTFTIPLGPGKFLNKRQGSTINAQHQHSFGIYISGPAPAYYPVAQVGLSSNDDDDSPLIKLTFEDSSTGGNVYPGDTVTVSYARLQDKTWSDKISVKPGAQSLAAGTAPAGFQVSRTITGGNYTQAGWGLGVYREYWSFGDVVWKDTEISVDGAQNHKWCDGLKITVEPVPTTYDSKPVAPKVTVTHGISASDVVQKPGACLLDEVRMVQPI